MSYALLAPRFFLAKHYGTYLMSAFGVRMLALGVVARLGRSVAFVDPAFTRSVLPVVVALFVVFMLASMAGTGLRMLREWRRLNVERCTGTGAQQERARGLTRPY